MRPRVEDRDLPALEAATCFVLTDSGRTLRNQAPDHGVGPRLYLGGSASGNVVRIRQDVGGEAAQALERLGADEPPLGEADSTPVHLGAYLEILAAEAPVERCEAGLAWVFPDRLGHDFPAAVLVSSHTPEGDRLLGQLAEKGMPTDVAALGFVDVGELWAPWCVVLHEGGIASIAFAARLTGVSAETGVATVPAFRGRGYAAAATAGWASHPALRGKTLFYSTSQANVSSQRVAARLGLRFIGATLSIS